MYIISRLVILAGSGHPVSPSDTCIFVRGFLRIYGETAARLVALTRTEPPHQATHWTGRAMAKAMGISLRSVQRIWQAHDLRPHGLRTFKRSRDLGFAAKLAEIVGRSAGPCRDPLA